MYVCTTVRAHSTIGPHDLEKRRKWSKEDTYFVKHKFFTSCASATIGAPACTLYVLLLFIWGHICLYISTNKTIFTKNKVLCGMLIRGWLYRVCNTQTHCASPIYRRPQSTAVLTIFSEVLDGIYQLHMFKYATYGATHSQGHSGCTATRSQKAENAWTFSVQIYWSIDLQSTHSSKSSWFLSSPASTITTLIQSISTSLENLQPLASSCTCRAQIRSYFNWQMDG